jgi:hypothetical protein
MNIQVAKLAKVSPPTNPPTRAILRERRGYRVILHLLNRKMMSMFQKGQVKTSQFRTVMNLTDYLER